MNRPKNRGKFFRRFAEKIARSVSGKEELKVMTTGAFHSLMRFSMWPFYTLAVTPRWCQATYPGDRCHPYRGRFCGGCPDASANSKCPAGYQVSYAYWNQTGCWCETTSTVTLVCCDCTLESNPYVRHPTDCGCGWAVPRGMQ
ncbi:hypothetical protein [Kroppenstedtia eburnea]|uniref:Uncharacterized protein n=1 Tax=Kroppenstedtia eburnea TaxID=714067 RepID=A0A1N7KWG6_9BACL|nr:hypothetical protein [Kroppenstedtia eburnea]QKI82775.1 hypothetical protein GXN75_12665 [Kroppenstedtia eburnea]SIS65982.1 hypothetical protein SAMN05421790_103312 [Kroppenstedtia eburnea]